MLMPMEMLKQQTALELKNCNETTIQYGIELSEPEIQLLIQNRSESLKSSGRIEFGGGILQKLILKFCDSPYIMQDNYVEMMQELQDAFYYFKNESLDILSDDELIHIMKDYFNNECQGSIDFLQQSKLEDMSRNVRFGKKVVNIDPYMGEDYE